MELLDNADYTWAAMQGKFGWMLAFTTWSFAISLAFAAFTNFLKRIMENMIPADAARVNKILNSTTYRFIKAIILALTAIRLPSEGKKHSGTTNPPFTSDSGSPSINKENNPTVSTTTTANSGTTPKP